MITIKIKDDEITAALTRLSVHLADLRPVMDDIGEYLVKSTKDRFGKGVSPDGVPWAPKSPVTLAAYGARKSNRIDTRPLFGPSNQLNNQIFHEATSNSVEVGSDRVYAAMMQFGGTKAQFPNLWGNIPARPFLGISPKDETNIVAILSEWAERAAAGGA